MRKKKRERVCDLRIDIRITRGIFPKKKKWEKKDSNGWTRGLRERGKVVLEGGGERQENGG